MPLNKAKHPRKKKNAKLTLHNKLWDPKNDEIVVSPTRSRSGVTKKVAEQGYSKASCDNVGVKRLYTPFNMSIGMKPIPYRGFNRPTGLSPREKNYVICSCQARASRYKELKCKARDAVTYGKIFSIVGSCNAVRKALVERGWVEKIPSNKMNLSRIRNGNFSTKDQLRSELESIMLSNLVDKAPVNFTWRTRDSTPNCMVVDMHDTSTAIVNKLVAGAVWTTKQGLCSSMKRNYWFYIENVAEVNGPRTYNSVGEGEVEGFVKDYKITACTSLLKWVLSMVANERPVFLETGTISLNIIVFALNRCKEYLFIKQNNDIDRPVSTVSVGKWNSFLKKYYKIIAKEAVFTMDTENKLPLYLCYAKILLKEMYKYRPQLSCEGCHNIWIIKPAHCSRGRGIRMGSKLSVLNNIINKYNNKFVIQKYIEEPLIIHETKFDIRQYYVITSTYPLVIWMYKDCYLKFSSQKYNLKDYHESIHLTNNAIQRKYKNCNGRNSALPQNNMWDLETYKNYLVNIGKENVWDKIIYPGMKKSIIGIMLSCQDSLPTTRKRFELYGCDFILDKEYKPWLIEINGNPDLNNTTHVTAKICPAVVSDVIKVVLDHAANPKASTGKFECIYHQPMTMPRYGSAAELSLQGHTLRPGYFYKGAVPVENSCGNLDLAKERDLKFILRKLRQICDEDIMVAPDDASSYRTSKDIRDFPIYEAPPEKFDTASHIADKIDELMTKGSSGTCESTSSEPTQKSYSSPEVPRSNSGPSVHSSSIVLENIRSCTRIQSLLKIPLNEFASQEKINTKTTFNFSKLDDDQSEMFIALTSKEGVQDVVGYESSKKDSLFQVTTKLITFIKGKQKEYSHDLKKTKRNLMRNKYPQV